MGRYIARRLLETIPLLLVISIFVFMFIHLLPGDPARQMAGLEAPPEEVFVDDPDSPYPVKSTTWISPCLSSISFT